MRIEIDNLGKTYGRSHPALDSVRLDLRSPSMIGLVGPNGAGKTTLMQLLVGQMLASAGTVRVDGADLQGLGKAFRRRLGYLPQNFGLYDELTVRQFLDYLGCLKGLPAPRRDVIAACIERAALTEKADARIRTLSGGQKQRVGIAQAMLNDPELLIVDEPTVGLDPEERIRFRNLFSRDAGRRLVILSTHIIEDVESICNRLIVLHQGRIRFDGAPSELVRRAEGHVGVIEVQGEREAAFEGRFRLTGRVVTAQGAACRIVGHDLPPGCRPVTPTLEDAYIYSMSNGAAS
ncbi:MAG: ATP-binding cassette domain-containing protein [Planctomycetes bacterium]|nr:ATP-binding cassette domain-containing protein [Planctomycetota bacterium]